MKILVVMGSPRNGEGYKAVQALEASMRALGEVEFDYLWLKDVNFGVCRGCEACIRFGEERCPLKDDRAAVEARMMAADGIILVTPVYSRHVSYLMKTFIDHLSYLYHRPRFFNKFAMGLATGGGEFKATLNYLKISAEAWGFNWVTQLGVAHPDSLVPKMRARLERDITRTAQKFYRAVQSNQIPAPSLGKLIWFRMWRINSVACRGYIPADFNHWANSGWYQQDYYSDAHIGWVNRVIARGVEKLMRRIFRGVYVGY